MPLEPKLDPPVRESLLGVLIPDILSSVATLREHQLFSKRTFDLSN
jgi:hypothetical protein